jgi:phage shock protein PspC (stress-responsive transcriptional regulator)
MEEKTIYGKKLYRSRQNRVLGGICGGLGEYFEIDPVLIRVLSIVGAFISGGALFLAYIILWIIVPEKSDPYVYGGAQTSDANQTAADINTPFAQTEPRGRRMLGFVLIGIGALLLIDNIFPLFDFWDYWPLLLIGAGILLVTNSFNK